MTTVLSGMYISKRRGGGDADVACTPILSFEKPDLLSLGGIGLRRRPGGHRALSVATTRKPKVCRRSLFS